MKTEFAARLYSEQFLRIVQLQKAADNAHLSVVEKYKLPTERNPSVSANPLYWDERWFANYE